MSQRLRYDIPLRGALACLLYDGEAFYLRVALKYGGKWESITPKIHIPTDELMEWRSVIRPEHTFSTGQGWAVVFDGMDARFVVAGQLAGWGDRQRVADAARQILDDVGIKF